MDIRTRVLLALASVLTIGAITALPLYGQGAIAATTTQSAQTCAEEPFRYGTSYDGQPLLAYRCGDGPSVRVIVGGIHGGYEWNTVELVWGMLVHLQERPGLVPENVTLYVIPCANPDGYAAGTDGTDGRMNGNGVDLNRNWDYEWQPMATHGTRPVSAGDSPFSEPETAALRGLIEDNGVEAVIFYHSAMARIFHGLETAKSATHELAVVVSEATGYPVAARVPGQITTGDAVDWMSAKGLPGIEIELSTHRDIEWARNLLGLRAFLSWVVPGSSPARAPTDLTSLVSVSASSSLCTDQRGQYQPWTAVDGRQSTAWAAGARGAGIGEWRVAHAHHP